MNAIDVENLKKSYGGRVVLNKLSFKVKVGETFAILGLNGAGKSTALECIEGFRKPDIGSVAVKGKTGILFQSAALPSFIRPLEAIELVAKWKKVNPGDVVAESLDINDMGGKIYADLTAGQKRRLHFALALIGNPDIIFLDEPTAGLDVESGMLLHEHIRRLKEKGKTILMVSKDLAEAEAVCDRIAILKDSELKFIGTADEFAEKVGRRHMVRIKTDCGEEVFDTDNIGETLFALFEQYKREGVTVLDINAERGTLEQHLRNLSESL